MREWLRDKRGDKTQEWVAESVGLKRNSYANYELGARTPSVQTAKKLGELLGFDWQKFYDEETEGAS